VVAAARGAGEECLGAVRGVGDAEIGKGKLEIGNWKLEIGSGIQSASAV
jgi:hypothetical protein